MLQFNWLVAPLLLTFFVSASLAFVVIRNRNRRLSIVPPFVLTASIAVWSLFDAARFGVTSLEWKLALHFGYYAAGAPVVISFFAFAADYSERHEWLRPRRLALVAAPLFVVFLLEVTNYRNLTVRSAQLVERGGAVFVDISWGPVFYTHHVLAFPILAAGAFMFLTYEKTKAAYRKQVRAIMLALVVPWGLNIAYVSGFTAVNYTTVGFTITVLIVAMLVVRYRMLDLLPVARASVVDEMDTGYLVLDQEDVVVDVNDRAAEVLDADTEDMLGETRAWLIETVPAIRAALEGNQEANETDGKFPTITHYRGGRRYYSVEASAFDDRIGEDTGTVILFQDVTDRIEARRTLRRQKEQLERQNERLEEFASILSHDVRNPLSVAEGHLELARAEHDSVHMRKIAAAHARIDELIEDALALAREGQAVIDRELVSVQAVARDAWTNVDTGPARLLIESDGTVTADESQLTQLFENLFRNAVEHGGPDVTVTVGAIPGSRTNATDDGETAPSGFYVADDGPGIPPEERNDVFEKGYTTAADGTGFGLAIVETVATAHGWSITLGESEDGGVRFEFRSEPDTPDRNVATVSDADTV